MTKNLILYIFFLLTLLPSVAFSLEDKSDRTVTSLDYFKKPFSRMENGADIRLRFISAENMQTLSDETPGAKWFYQRYRARIWSSINLNETMDFNARVVWEFFDWQKPYHKNEFTEYSEILFDNFNFTLRKPLGLPVTALIGRQDIILGNGWLVFEGTPYDASRTLFFDAARFTFDLQRFNSTLDIIYIDQKPEAGRWLKPISYERSDLMPAEERGLILYLVNRPDESRKFETYVLLKNDNPLDREVIPLTSKKAKILTLGGAVEHRLNERWDYRIEAAIQTGKKEDRAAGRMNDMKSWGMVSRLNRSFNDPMSNRLHFSFEHLSGDRPGTSDNEQFDPVWGKWTQWSTLYLYTYIPETSLGEITNFSRFNIGHVFSPAPKWQIETDYHLLLTDENNKPAGPSASGGLEYTKEGRTRGHFLINCIRYNYSRNLKTDLLTELFSPGNYYEENTRDCAYFVRWQVTFTF